MNERELRTIRALTDELRALRQQIGAAQQQAKPPEAEHSEQPIRPPQIEVQTDSITQTAIREHYEAENRERNSWWGRNKPRIETTGVAVAGVLALLTLLTMREIRKQTPAIIDSAKAAKSAAKTADETLKTTRALTEGTSEAICYGDVDCRDSEKGICQFNFSNVGHVAAKMVHAHIEFSLRLIVPSNTQIGKTDVIDLEQEEIAPRIAGNFMYAPGHGDINKPIEVPMLKLHKSEIENGKRALMINITLSYDNGFGSQRSAPYCQEMVYPRTGPLPNRVRSVVPCDGPFGIASFIEEQRKIDNAAKQQGENQKR